MQNSIELSITNIKNISTADLQLPYDKGMYALVGENGCGKSTIMHALSLLIKASSYKLLRSEDIREDSKIILSNGEKNDTWYYENGQLTTGILRKHYRRTEVDKNIILQGFYEGSIFFGTRFYDYQLIDSFISKPGFEKELIEADDFVKMELGYILHNDVHYYSSLKKIKTKEIARNNRFRGIPYFLFANGQYISQYRMSSGESVLISLIDFINNLVVRDTGAGKLLFLIDEVELALHPSAIDRLIEEFKKWISTSKKDLVVYFSTHSAELLHRISNKNIFLIENKNGVIDITNPCYPNYAIRNLYVPNGYDFIFLVEDQLAKALVEKVIRDNNLNKSKLLCVLPAGGCEQMLQLHQDMISYNTLGVGKRIISIYDGDVQDEIAKKEGYKDLPKCFLPIPSIEKYLLNKLCEAPDKMFIKLIGDKYFTLRALPEILKDYQNDERTKQNKKKDGKALYSVLCSNLEKAGMDEDSFLKYLCDDIYAYEDISGFIKSLTALVN